MCIDLFSLLDEELVKYESSHNSAYNFVELLGQTYEVT